VKLTRIHLESFKCFGKQLELPPFSERITVIHGPNGTGKSTLMLALERALFDRPDTQDAEIAALQPWGAQVTPRVELDFTVGDESYRIEKSFGPKGQARLHRKNGSGELQPWKEGSAATEWVRERFGGRQPARGATRPEHRGLGQILFAPQGALPLPDKLGDGAVERLRALVAQVTVDAGTRAIETELKRRHDAIFTATGQLKKGSPAQVARAALDEAEKLREQAVLALAEIDRLASQVAALQTEVATREERRRVLLGERERLAPLGKLYRLEKERHATARATLDTATRQFREIADRIDALDELRRRIAGLERESAPRTAAATAATAAQKAAEAALQQATTAREAHESGRAALRSQRQVAEDARKLTRAREELASLAGKLSGLQSARAQVAQLEARLTQAPGSFSGMRIKALRELLAEERSASEKLEALKLRVRITAERQLTVEGQALGAGESTELTGEGKLSIALPGVGRIEVAGPAVDTAGDRAHLTELTRAADALAAELGSRDPSTLEVWRAEWKAIDKELGMARAALAEKGSATAAEERQRILERAVALLVEAHPEWAQADPDPMTLEIALRDDEQRFEETLRELHRAEDHARRQATEARATADRNAQALIAAQRDQQAAAGQLELLAGDGLSDEQRALERRERSAARQKAEDDLHAAESALAQLGADPEAALEKAERELESVSESLSQRREELARRTQTLDDASKYAPHAMLADAEERAATARATLGREERDAEAVNLLWTLFEEERAHVTARLTGPIVSRVVPRMKKLTGGKVEGIELADLAVRGVRVAQSPELVSPDALSHGTRDQLALLCRLALAEIVAGDEPLPVVLDDPLVHADKQRQKRLLSLIEENAERLQVIVMTCHPEDYKPLASATFLDLAAPLDLFGGR
jgi:DNA repair protein SbcC/Rad50